MGSGLRLGSRQSRDRADQQYGSDIGTISDVGPEELKLIHQEYWIPAGDLEEFNKNMVGPIEVVAEFRMGETKGREHS
jgi:hypothetical protein